MMRLRQIIYDGRTLTQFPRLDVQTALVSSLRMDLIFSLEGGNGVVAQWQLKGVFPKSYSVSDADATTAELATETIELCVTEIQRMK